MGHASDPPQHRSAAASKATQIHTATSRDTAQGPHGRTQGVGFSASPTTARRALQRLSRGCGTEAACPAKRIPARPLAPLDGDVYTQARSARGSARRGAQGHGLTLIRHCEDSRQCGAPCPGASRAHAPTRGAGRRCHCRTRTWGCRRRGRVPARPHRTVHGRRHVVFE